MNQDFYKKPSFIACGIIILSALFLSLFKFSYGKESQSVTSLQTITKGVSFSDSGDWNAKRLAKKSEYFWNQMNDHVGIGAFDMLTFLIPLLAGILMFVDWNGTNNIIKDEYIRPIKLSLLAISGIFILRYLLKIGISVPGTVSFGPGLGLWLILLASIFIFFEDKIVELVKSNLKK